MEHCPCRSHARPQNKSQGYSASLSFRIEGAVKSFPDKQKLKYLITSKPALQEMLKKLVQEEIKDHN